MSPSTGAESITSATSRSASTKPSATAEDRACCRVISTRGVEGVHHHSPNLMPSSRIGTPTDVCSSTRRSRCHTPHRALAAVLNPHAPDQRRPNLRRRRIRRQPDPFPHEMCALFSHASAADRFASPSTARRCIDQPWPSPSYIEVFDADEDGRVAGLDVDALIDGGAFASFELRDFVQRRAGDRAYELGSFHYTGARVWTNKPPAVPCAATERSTPAAPSRSSWTTSPSNWPWTPSICAWPIPAAARPDHLRIPHHQQRMREALRRVKEESGWDESSERCPGGIGIGCGFFISGSGPNSLGPQPIPRHGYIQVDMDGGVTVHTGAADIGQGSTTAVAQVVSEVLALPLDMIHVRSHESDTSPVDLGSYSSRVTFMNCNAAIRAAMEFEKNCSMRHGTCSTTTPPPW